MGDVKHTAGRFAEYRTEELAAQCRMQARENLDPEYSQFMFAVADRLSEPGKAAPALLEACRRALRHAQNIGIDSEGSSYVNTLRAAIALATEDGR